MTGQALAFTYDALGRNLTQSGPFGTTTSQYDAAGRRSRFTWPDGLYVTYDYLTTDEMIATRENGAPSGAGVLATYAYDDLGRRTGIARGNGTTTSYGFDSISRLSSLGHDLSSSTYDLSLGFTHSPASQIAGMTRSNDAYAYGGRTNINLAYTANGLNQAAAVGVGTLGYDARGNLNSISKTGGTPDIYTYSPENLLKTGPSGAGLTYDPLGRLFKELTPSIVQFQYDGDRMIAEYNNSGVMQRRYVYGPGIDEPIVWYEGSGTSDRRWLHADERGSVIAVTAGSGAAIAINAYDEYGVPASSNIGRFQYTGQAWLPSFGLYYYKARIYSSKLGRFMQVDPSGYGDGMNGYAYVRGDPANSSDPSGLSKCTSPTQNSSAADRSSYEACMTAETASTTGYGSAAMGNELANWNLAMLLNMEANSHIDGAREFMEQINLFHTMEGAANQAVRTMQNCVSDPDSCGLRRDQSGYATMQALIHNLAALRAMKDAVINSGYSGTYANKNEQGVWFDKELGILARRDGEGNSSWFSPKPVGGTIWFHVHPFRMNDGPGFLPGISKQDIDLAIAKDVMSIAYNTEFRQYYWVDFRK